MKKIVNGVEVEMTQADIDEYNAKEAAWEASKNERLQERYSDALQSHIDAVVKARNYNDGFACASYANSTNATWKQEAIDFIAWRDACWEYALDIKAQVDAEEIQAPSLEEFIANAPTLTWS